MLDGRDKRLIVLRSRGLDEVLLSVRLVMLGRINSLSEGQSFSGMSDRARGGRGESHSLLGRLLLVSRNTLETVGVVIVSSRLNSASRLKRNDTRKSSNSRNGAVVGLVRLAVGRGSPGARNLQIRREATALLMSRQFGFGAV
jgi:hypothetical protein